MRAAAEGGRDTSGNGAQGKGSKEGPKGRAGKYTEASGERRRAYTWAYIPLLLEYQNNRILGTKERLQKKIYLCSFFLVCTMLSQVYCPKITCFTYCSYLVLNTSGTYCRSTKDVSSNVCKYIQISPFCSHALTKSCLNYNSSISISSSSC